MWFRRLYRKAVCWLRGHAYVWIKIGDTRDAEEALYGLICLRCGGHLPFVNRGTLFPKIMTNFAWHDYPLSTSKEGMLMLQNLGRRQR